MWDKLKLALTPKRKIDQPIQLIIFVTDRCNARCVHCFNWRSLNQGGDDLSLSELEHLSAELGSLQTIGISGGEPFLREDLPEIFDLFSGRNHLVDIAIPTNGLMPERITTSVRRMLEKNQATRISISLSLDGLESMHDRIRGVPGSFEKIYETYQALVELRSQYPQYPLLIKIGTTLCNWNIYEIPALIKWVSTEMPEVDFHNFEIMRGCPRNTDIGPPSITDLKWVKSHIFSTWQQYSFYGNDLFLQSWLALSLKRFIFMLYIEIIQKKKQVIPCYAGRTSVVVDSKGKVYFCELRESIGNLREVPLSEIWHSEKAEYVRDSIEKGECHCVHSCFQQKNVFLNPRLWPHILLYSLSGKFTLPRARHIHANTSKGKET
jgi:MoaA/NifB/PqqE/SkfB family radical SAM enzyme